MSFAAYLPTTADGDARRAGREALSLALMAARNRTLAWANALAECLASPTLACPRQPDLDPPLWLLGHVAWYQEAWIARNVQRQRGSSADASRPRLASVEPSADGWYDPAAVDADARWSLALPDVEATRRYLADTLEVTLELLTHAEDSDEGLYFYRRARLHEEMQAETLACLAQALGVDTGLVEESPPGATRPPIGFPSTCWRLGAAPGGLVLDNEKWAHEVAVPEFEIDAQPVTWSQFVDFVEDGGYDEPRWWSPEGLDWLQREARRVPRHVEQLRHGVLQRRFGRLVRVPAGRAVTHVTVHEAEAWCRWAGRRLPTEVEWEAAVHLGAARGFRWGEAWEWTATGFRPYPGFVPDPDRAYSAAGFGCSRVLRGASFATPSAARHRRFRGFLAPGRDDAFCGFRSCAA